MRRRLGNDKVQRATKRYDHDGHSKYNGLRLLPLAAVSVVTRAAPSTNEETSNERREEARGENTPHSASCKAGWIRSSMMLSAF